MNKKLLLFFIGFLITKSTFSQNDYFKIAEKNYKKSVEFETTNIDSSFAYIKKAYTSLKTKDTINTIFTDILNQYGRVYFHKREYTKSYSFFNRSYKISKSSGRESDAYKIKVNMALCQRQLNNTKIALKDLFEIIGYFEEKDETNINLGKTYINVADLYLLNKQHQIAETYYQKSLSFFKDNKTVYTQLQGNRIANFNAFDTNKSLEIINVIESTTILDSIPIYSSAPLYNSIAQTMVKTGDYKKGLDYTLKCLDVKKKGGLKISIAIQYNNIGDIYIKTEDYPLAITYLDSALQTAKTHRQKFQILKNLQKAHKGNNDLEKSLEYANTYITLKDSLNEVLTQKEIVELGIKYNTKQKNKFINKLKNLSIIYKILILFIILLSVFLLRNLFIKNKKVKNEFEILQDELNTFKEEKAKKNALTNNKIIHLKSKAVLNSNNILYVKSDGHYVEYFLDNKTNPEIDRNSLNDVLKTLPSNSFTRIHKSFVVNINRIKIINSTKVILDNGVWINLSRIYKQQLKDILHKDD